MALTLTPRRSEATFRVRTGLSIQYPFIAPTGIDTGVEETSYYDTIPYTYPTDWATHIASGWLANVAVDPGFDHIRLVVNPGPILESNLQAQPERKTALLNNIATAVDDILAVGLKCYIALELTGFPTGYSAAAYSDGSMGPKFLRYKEMVQDFAFKFSTYDPVLFALELFHEPPATTTWPAMMQQLHMAARLFMPNHTLIATAGGYSDPDDLAAFDPSPYDKNTLWAFHWRPLSSRQGYNLDDETKWFDGADWEKRPDQRPAILAKVTSRVNADSSITNKTSKISSVMATYDLMVTRGRDYIESQVAAARAWATTHQVSIICSEHGITSDNPVYYGMPEASRIENTHDIETVMAKYGVPRTTKASDSQDYHIPGAPAGAMTLDNFESDWITALAPNQGWMLIQSTG